MHFVYGETRCNDRTTTRIYQSRFSDPHHLSHKMFAIVYQRLRKQSCHSECLRHVRLVDFEKKVLSQVEELLASFRAIATWMGISQSTVWYGVVWYARKLLHFYPLQQGQDVGSTDYEPRMQFSRYSHQRVSVSCQLTSGLVSSKPIWSYLLSPCLVP